MNQTVRDSQPPRTLEKESLPAGFQRDPRDLRRSFVFGDTGKSTVDVEVYLRCIL